MTPTDLFDLSGTVSVVTGASGRLGPTITAALAGAGSTVVAVGRSRERLHAALAEVSGDVVPTVCDIRTGAWPELIRSVAAERGGLDVLVNNAHVPRGGSLRTATTSDWHEAFDLAVHAPARGMEAARPALTESARRGGPAAILNVSSMYALRAPDPAMYDTEEQRNPPAYGTAKAALLQLTRYGAAEFAEAGIRVNALLLGPFPGTGPASGDTVADRIAARTMLGRTGTPGEIATAVLYLASAASSFTTGSTVHVDGGWTAR